MSAIDQIRWRLDPRPAEVLNRNEILSVELDGQTLRGFAGDTAVSLLGAHGVRTFFGSVRESRPGGVRTAGTLDRDAWVWVDGEGLVPAGSHRLRDGDRLSGYQRRASTPSARSPIVRWPVASRSAVDRQSLPGAPLTPAWLAALRRVSSRATVLVGGRMHADVVVVGGGIAGMAAARAAADAGADVVLVEADPWLGGSARWSAVAERQQHMAELEAIIRDHPGIAVLSSATAVEAGVDSSVTVVERSPVRERVWVLRAPAVVLACGLLPRSVPFSGSHLPGVMAPTATRRLVELWAVRPGQRALLACDERSADATTTLANDLADVGVDIAGVTVVGSAAGHLQARGQLGVEEVVLPSGRVVQADLLITSFGTGVDTALLQGLGAVVTRSGTHELVVDRIPASCTVVGSMVGGHGTLRSASLGAEETLSGQWRRREARAAQGGRRAAVRALRQGRGGLSRTRIGASRPQTARSTVRSTPPAPPLVFTGTDPSVARPVSGLLDATTDLMVDGIDGFAGSSPAATEILVVRAARRPGLSPAARLVLADLAASGAESKPVVDLTLQFDGPLDGPTLGGLSALHQPSLRASALVEWHRAAGAVLGRCEGWIEVLQYHDAEAETNVLATGVGLQDLGPRACFEVSGPAAAAVMTEALGADVALDRLDGLVEHGPYRRVRTGPCCWQISAPTGLATALAAALHTACLDRVPWEVHVADRHEDLGRMRLIGAATWELVQALNLDAVVGRRQRVQVGAVEAWALLRSNEECELQVPAELALALWTELLALGDRFGLRAVGVDATDAFDRPDGYRLDRAASLIDLDGLDSSWPPPDEPIELRLQPGRSLVTVSGEPAPYGAQVHLAAGSAPGSDPGGSATASASASGTMGIGAP
ncbi:MAG: FAD-dependent oxidoreductase [Acidimicrobiales bacterium]